MESSLDDIQKRIKLILSQRRTKPSPEICSAIANIKDLIDIHGAPTEWRKIENGSQQQPGSPYRFHSSSSSESFIKRPNFRGGNDSPISRVSSSKSMPSPDCDSPPPPVPKYQSKFKNTNQPVEDKILNNIILSKLNKFSPKTYNEIRDFLYQILGTGEASEIQEMIHDFILLVFRKAAAEETFCSLYAKLLSEISGRYSIILQEMHTLQRNYLAIFDDIQDPTSKDYGLFVEAQTEKRYRRGYSQFIAELITLNILNLDLLKSTFKLIIKNMIAFGKMEDKKTLLEEYSDCILRMAKVLKKNPAKAVLYLEIREELLEMIENYKNYPSISAKTKFMLMDVQENLVSK